jgi:ribosome-binding protein aMBF1 (putative translation factor)
MTMARTMPTRDESNRLRQRATWALAVALQDRRLQSLRESKTMRATREDVQRLLSDVDEFVLEQLLAVGASKEELHEAVITSVMEFEMGEAVEASPNPKVAELCAIIEDLLSDERTTAESEIYPFDHERTI